MQSRKKMEEQLGKAEVMNESGRTQQGKGGAQTKKDEPGRARTSREEAAPPPRANLPASPATPAATSRPSRPSRSSPGSVWLPRDPAVQQETAKRAVCTEQQTVLVEANKDLASRPK
jgi:hypothetical protein